MRSMVGVLLAAMLLLLFVGPAAAGAADGDFDFNGDGSVDDADAALLQDAMGSEPGDPTYSEIFDADEDGLIAGTDWAAFVQAMNAQ